VVSRYEDVLWALRHPEIFSSEMELQMALGTDRPMIPQQVDPPAQTRYRKILDPRFSRKRMLEVEPTVRKHANELIDSFIDAGECEFNGAFAVPLPCTAFLQMMGLPLDHLSLFLELKDGIIRPSARGLEEAKQMRAETGRRIYDYFERALDERAAHPGDDMLSYLQSAEIDGERLTREEVLDISFLLLLAGLDTVTATLGCNVAFLAENPAQRARLVAAPALIPNAVEELLRWETPVTAVPRLMKQDAVVSGFELHAGEMVTLLVGAANVDEAEFDHGDDVDFDREHNRHLAFGGGPHRCLGSHLARMELRVALEVLHERIPDYRIKPGDAPRYSPGIREVQHLPLVWERP
jgi:cytochrome P450